MKIYYAHSISIYNTSQEKRDIKSLESLGFDVVNPNKEIHQENYRSKGMDYFVELVNSCDAIAFRAHPNGDIPAGIYKEIQADKPIIELPSSINGRKLTVDETREYLKEVGFR